MDHQTVLLVVLVSLLLLYVGPTLALAMWGLQWLMARRGQGVVGPRPTTPF